MHTPVSRTVERDVLSARPHVTVVVPAFNEAETIERTIGRLRELAPAFDALGRTLRIYVVDDGSSDQTRLRAEAAGCDRVLRHRVNRGLGAAVRTGLNAARNDGAEIAVKFDADLQHDPTDILEMIKPILQDEADLVYGNRFERISYRMPLVRRWGNVTFTGLMRKLTGWPLKDSQPGIFAAAECYLAVFSLPGDYNYTQQILLDAYHKGMRFAHVPVGFDRRETGKSFVSLKYPLKVIPQIVMVLVSVKPLTVFGGVGAISLAIAGLIGLWQMGWWMAGVSDRPVTNVNLVLALLLFGFQSLFFGLLAQLVIMTRR